jgi:Protein of unknown function (DUF2934)
MVVKKGPKPADKSGDISARIREAAYHHWQERGRPEGTALDDWLYAEAGFSGVAKKKRAPAKKAPVKKSRP